MPSIFLWLVVDFMMIYQGRVCIAQRTTPGGCLLFISLHFFPDLWAKRAAMLQCNARIRTVADEDDVEAEEASVRFIRWLSLTDSQPDVQWTPQNLKRNHEDAPSTSSSDTGSSVQESISHFIDISSYLSFHRPCPPDLRPRNRVMATSLAVDIRSVNPRASSFLTNRPCRARAPRHRLLGSTCTRIRLPHPRYFYNTCRAAVFAESLCVLGCAGQHSAFAATCSTSGPGT
jgi:hypothetical protein